MRFRWALLFIVCFSCLLVACSDEDEQDQSQDQNDQGENNNQSEGGPSDEEFIDFATHYPLNLDPDSNIEIEGKTKCDLPDEAKSEGIEQLWAIDYSFIDKSVTPAGRNEGTVTMMYADNRWKWSGSHEKCEWR